MFGKHFDVYAENANQLLIVAQIEHIRGVQNIDDILSVEGLDAIMVGPYDLSGSLDLTAQFDHPQFLQVMDKIHLKAKEHKIPMGLHLVQPDRGGLEAKIAEGYQFIAYGIDAVFLYRAAKRPEADVVLK
jgi:2-dehydro-3-deoxyglucarate aldolase